ncbi:MAG: hypothetical protein ACXAD7_26895 [Candidatus Kariarchaeaceae archaeon]|jgi:hypothetical protein
MDWGYTNHNKILGVLVSIVCIFIPTIIEVHNSPTDQQIVYLFLIKGMSVYEYEPGFGIQILNLSFLAVLLMHIPLLLILRNVFYFEFPRDWKQDIDFARLNANIIFWVLLQYLIYWLYAKSLVIGGATMSIEPYSLIIIALIAIGNILFVLMNKYRAR